MQNFFTPIGGIISEMLSLVIDLFPTVDTPTLTYINSQVSAFNSLIGNASWIFPVGTIIDAFKLIIGFEIIILGIRGVLWIASMFTLGIVKNKI
jgi:hypothetical protein